MNLQHLQSAFLAITIGIAVSYIGISTYDKLIEAQELQLFTYTYYQEPDDGTNQRNCPELVYIDVDGETDDASALIKDNCTNLYWHSIDLPLTNPSGALTGHTWDEAKLACENLGRTSDSGSDDLLDDVSLFRLPTSEELQSLLNIPCSEVDSLPDISEGDPTVADTPNDINGVYNNGCSFLTTRSAKAFDRAEGTFKQILPSVDIDDDFYTRTYNRNNTGNAIIRFADGIYWTSDEIDIDGPLYDGVCSTGQSNEIECTAAGGTWTQNDPPTEFEAATSVNMYTGETNNPIFNKDARLNVRCIAKNVDVQDVNAVQSDQYKVEGGIYSHVDIVEDIDFDNLRLIQRTTTGCSSGAAKYRMAYVKNWSPLNDDVNECPVGMNDDLTVVDGISLCTGISPLTDTCIDYNN